MLEIDVCRDCKSSRSTTGLIRLPGRLTRPYGVSLELPWMDGRNIPRRSAILEGLYLVTEYVSPHFMKATKGNVERSTVLLLHDVPGRDMCQLHPANRPEQLLGCVAPGFTRGPNYITQSRPAFDGLLKLAREEWTKNEQVWIRIRSEYRGG